VYKRQPFYLYLLFPAKEFVIKTIDRNYSGDEAGYLKGLVTGDRGDISDEMKESFINAGVMHLIAVSGLNVAYVILTVSLLLAILRVPLIPRVLITICFLIFYCIFTGSAASIVRASIMGILVLIAMLIERRINFYNIAGVAAMCILLYDTKQLFDPGFILSFSATLSMVIFFKQFEFTLIDRLKELNVSGKKVTLLIAVLFFTSLSAQIGTIPITASYFGKISVVSLIANVIAVPLANLSLAMGFLQIIFELFSDYLSSVIAETINLLLYIQLQFIKWCASLDFAFIEAGEITFADIVCYYILIILLLSIRNSKQLAFRIVLCALIMCGLYVLKYEFSGKLTVTFLDIGQGDCALIQTPDEKTILVDCGAISLNSNSGERTILPYLKRKGIRKIDLLIITHLHLDHIGGINHLIKNIEIGKIVESGQDHKSLFINTMDSLILIKNIPREIVRNGDCITGLNDIRIYFLFPDKRFVNSEGKTIGNNLNNGSVAFILKYKNTDFFFSGDIEKESELFLCNTYSEFLETDVLKVAHHGSKTSTTQHFVDMNKPDYAVISCGINNKFNHPSEVTLARLDKAGADVSRTDLEGAVIFESDGERVKKIEWR
jgi:competence protein ComEC